MIFDINFIKNYKIRFCNNFLGLPHKKNNFKNKYKL